MGFAQVENIKDLCCKPILLVSVNLLAGVLPACCVNSVTITLGHTHPCAMPPAITKRKSGVLAIYKNHPVGNFRHKHKTIKCEVARVGITIKYIHISQTDREQKNSITSYYSPYFLKLPKRNGTNHLIFQLEFPVFLCKW